MNELTTHAGMSLGYTGIRDLRDIEKINQERINLTKIVGELLAKHGFRIIDETEIRVTKKKAARRDGRLTLSERFDESLHPLGVFFEEAATDRNGFFWTVVFGMLCFGVIGISIAYIVHFATPFLTNVDTEASFWSGVLSVPLTVGICFLCYCLWKFTPLATTWKFRFIRIPLADYKPATIPESLLQRLEVLYQDLCQNNVPAEFFVAHGTSRDKKDLVEIPQSISERVEFFNKAAEETSFIELQVTFQDGEKVTITIAKHAE